MRDGQYRGGTLHNTVQDASGCPGRASRAGHRSRGSSAYPVAATPSCRLGAHQQGLQKHGLAPHELQQPLPSHLPGGGASSVRSVCSMPRTLRSIVSSLSTGRSALLPAGTPDQRMVGRRQTDGGGPQPQSVSSLSTGRCTLRQQGGFNACQCPWGSTPRISI